MDISAEWAGVAVAATAAIFTGVGWMLSQKQRTKDVQPIATFRGHAVEIINRANEPLRVTRIECESPVHTGHTTHGGFGPDDKDIYQETPVDPGWEIPPLATRWFTLHAEDRRSSITITMASSLKTVRRKRAVLSASNRE